MVVVFPTLRSTQNDLKHKYNLSVEYENKGLYMKWAERKLSKLKVKF
jgi:hypothetical protein